MPLDWIFFLGFPALLIGGIIAQIVRVRRKGLRGREAFRAIGRPAQILMQASATAKGLPAPEFEIGEPSPNNSRSTTSSN